MNAVAGSAHDRTLVQSLTGIISNLRSRQLGGPRNEPQGSLHRAADRFVGELADHLRYTEEALFPALREIKPGTAYGIEEMEESHRLLQRCVRDLAHRITAQSDEETYEVARSFLATVLDHFGRETAMLGRIVNSFDDLQTQRLTVLLSSPS